MKIAKPRKEAIDGREMEKGIVKGCKGEVCGVSGRLAPVPSPIFLFQDSHATPVYARAWER